MWYSRMCFLFFNRHVFRPYTVFFFYDRYPVSRQDDQTKTNGQIASSSFAELLTVDTSLSSTYDFPRGGQDVEFSFKHVVVTSRHVSTDIPNERPA